jgi:hypothetical protein
MASRNVNIEQDLRNLFGQALRGRMPSREQLGELSLSGSNVRERAQLRESIQYQLNAVARAAATEGANTAQLAERAEGQISRLAGQDGGGDGDDPASMALKIERSPATYNHPTRHDRTSRNTLANALRNSAMTGQPLDAGAYAPSSSMTAEQRAAWQAKLQAGAERAVGAWKNGQQHDARRMADELASELASGLHVEPPKDPTDGLTDPRDFAKLIPR